MSIKKRKQNKFKFKQFSKKQMQILTWWQDGAPTEDRFFIIADGSIRSGKTVSMTLSFLLFVMRTFNHMDAAVAGKTIGSLRRNLVNPLKQIAETLDFDVIDHRSENYIEITKGDVSNNFWLFGGKLLCHPL